MKKILLQSLLILVFCISLNAQNIYVDNIKGHDSNNGSKQAPFKTIKRGIKELHPGKILFLTPNLKPYSEAVKIKNIKGTSSKPIIIDGCMSVLSGAQSLNHNSWQPLKDSIYKKKIKKRFKSKRYFIIIDKKPQRMGIHYKLRRLPFKKLEELKAGEWTFNKKKNNLYVKLPVNKKLSDISEPKDNPHSGVMISGNSSHIIIRNMIVENFINDGYNIHGTCKNILFQNIVARNCGDDGISAHGTCDIKVKNFISVGNPSAICHVDKAIAKHENILITNTAGVNLLLLNSKNSFTNLIIKSSGDLDFINGEIILKNALFEHPGKEKPLLKFKTRNVSFQNVFAKSYCIKNKPSSLILFSEQNVKKFNNRFVSRTLNAVSFLSKQSK